MFYKRSTWRETYAHHIARIPQQEEWIVPPQVANLKIDPPAVVRLPGRPRMSRYPSAGERAPTSGSRRPRRCSSCRGLGHTRPNCPNETDDEEEEEEEEED
jgi:hypothetical protein